MSEQYDKQEKAYRSLEERLMDLVENDELWNRRKQIFEDLAEAFKKSHRDCDICHHDYQEWSIPTEWWNRLPEDMRDKCLCFGCYMKKIGVI